MLTQISADCLVTHDMFTQPWHDMTWHVWAVMHGVWPATRDVFDQSCMTVLMECRSSTYQEGAEEDEGDEVWDGEVDSTLILEPIGRVWVTQPSAHARQHDLLPVLSCCTPIDTTDNWLQNTCLYPHTCSSKQKERVIIYTVFWFYIHSKKCHFFVIQDDNNIRVTILTATKCWICDIGYQMLITHLDILHFWYQCCSCVSVPTINMLSSQCHIKIAYFWNQCTLIGLYLQLLNLALSSATLIHHLRGYSNDIPCRVLYVSVVWRLWPSALSEHYNVCVYHDCIKRDPWSGWERNRKEQKIEGTGDCWYRT